MGLKKWKSFDKQLIMKFIRSKNLHKAVKTFALYILRANNYHCNMNNGLTISAALGEMLVPGRVFGIGARKVNGDWTEKTKCVLVHNTRNELGQRKYWSRNGLLKLREVGGSHEFNIYIDLLVSFNGQEINWEA